jgi:hypothetical protein
MQSISVRALTVSIALAALPAAAGCSASVSPDLVRAKAASDLDCKAVDVQVEKINDGNWKAKGCAKIATYVCSGSNFMSDGMCMREGTTPTSATMK